MNQEEILALDAKHLWHPYTSFSKPTPVLSVASTQGVHLELTDGRKLIDGMSSWWSTIHGYNHPVLNQAIIDQSQKMSHVMFGGLTHEPAVTLGKKLVDITCDNLQHVFLADSGSVAVEVAIKMALQYCFAQGQTQKTKLLTARNGYYGDTFGGMAVCDPVNGMHEMFTGVLPQHIFAAAPQTLTESGEEVIWKPEFINDFKTKLEQNHEQIAAVIIEPMVQNAGGMRFYHAEYLQAVRQLCDQYDVLLILDEIATGFGRTGTLFAYEQANIQPDILTVGKALTGGTMTLAATLTSRKVVDGIEADGKGLLMHGPTFMGNPLACSVANASIELLLSSPWRDRVKAISAQLKAELLLCIQLDCVKEVRVKGAIGVVELHEPLDTTWSQPRFTEKGVWLRPFGKLVYLMPAYIMESSTLRVLTSAIYDVLSEWQKEKNACK
ncbi:adenosylmethionine--8-amino-7-oxononanoate transaminase [Cocleimonas sp. KMM 6892]|uniref:adenosylmethionine--8-amino-7-oxononanoate transaminase n=1 Tax=unclassified Cocleimonas TaxID=2639732 RepID=UPI002DB570A1|nr:MULTISPECIES: adenosylmethionine--8-amino-7-oxononanoate transaminase [unclassified Cocleimonas]MEB8432149.1 adenosylmethionine--8-amino-7-oxononanoate transaminase [Cocleimonas sp. KMM 6892]MEC4714765.1 adenosylmethionine--8-amino-7-oxononanoate transaminase [Cocleimonas sp. KMM 6895]MEC4744421.1 adenosylmethionine--8-amino-7-oxononanoate transaminase [Cocleimonas sp. KMM 6896]